MSDISKLTERTIGGLKVEPVAKRTNFFNIMFYGNSGVGKTLLAGSASLVPELSPVLFIDFEGGTMSIQDLYPEVDTVRINTWQQMQDVYEELYEGRTGYRTVVLDSLTEIQKFSMLQIMEELVKKDPSRDIDVPSEREWGKNLEQTRKFVRAFRDLPMNVIFTALAMEDKDKKTNLTSIKPSLTGKSKNEIPGFLDIVLYYYMVEKKDKGMSRVLLTSSTDKVAAKDRSGKLPQIVENPTMEMLYKLITGETK